MDGSERREKDDFEFDEDARDGAHGIPVTYTRDILADLLTEEFDRHHPDLPVNDVVMPGDILDAMADGLRDAPVFAASERGEFENRVVPVKEYIHERQEEDVLEALLLDHRPEADAVEEYIEHVYAWATGGTVATDRGGEVDPDPLMMKVFEVEQLGFDDADFAGTEPSDAVASFRRNKIITALNRHAWEHRTEDFEIGDVDLSKIPVLRDVLSANDWDDVSRTFEDLDPSQWDDPPAATETERVKETTIETMIDLFDYSPAAAELTSRHVLKGVTHRWD